MAYSDAVKADVRRDFIRGMGLKEAAVQHDLPYETARGWKRKCLEKGDDWDMARAAVHISAGGVQTLTNEVIEDFIFLFKSTIEAIKADKKLNPLQKAETLARLSDAYQKTVKAAGDSNPKLSRLAVAMDVIHRQGNFIREHFPQHQMIFIEILEPFGEELSRAFN